MSRFCLSVLVVAASIAWASSALADSTAAASLKILVEQDRIYRVTGADMTAAGVDLHRVDPARMNLYNEGHPIPLQVRDLGPNGSFEPGSSLIFWGEFPRGKEARADLFTKENAYLLVFESADPPVRYRPAKPVGAGSGEQVIESWPKTLHLEQDSLLVYKQHYYGMPTDRTMWRSFKAPPRDAGSVAIGPIHDLATAARPSRVRILLWGSSYLPPNPDHDWSFSLNGHALGSARWDGTTHLIFESDSIGDAFKPGGPNTLAVRDNLPGDQIDAILMDWIELDYEAALKPVDDFLEFEIPATQGIKRIQTTPGFSGSDVRVYDVAAGLEFPAAIPATTKRGYAASFRYSADAEKARLAVVGPKGYVKPTRLLQDYPSSLGALQSAPDYLVVTHKDFIDGARTIAQRRESQGLSTLVVDIEDIYDEYSDGRFSPSALRLFLDDLLAKPASKGKGLRYVFLIGDASSDFKHVEKGSAIFVPTYFETAEGDLPDYWPMYARDDYFVYGSDGKSVPKAAIGRLPCRTRQELQNFIDKLAEFEALPPAADTGWAKRGVFIGAEGFTDMPKQVSRDSVFRGWAVDTIFAKPGDVEGNVKLQERILGSLDRGASAVYFVGHGAFLRWRTGPFDPNHQTDLFTKEHLAKLNNQRRYPIVFTATCYSAMFDNPGALAGSESGIGVYMVEAERKGAIACIGHVGKTAPGPAQVFSLQMMRDIFTGAAPRLGDAFFAAKQKYHANEWAGITLIGDPATYFGNRYAAASGTSSINNGP